MKKIRDIEGTFGFFSGEIIGDILRLDFEKNIMSHAADLNAKLDEVVKSPIFSLRKPFREPFRVSLNFKNSSQAPQTA